MASLLDLLSGIPGILGMVPPQTGVLTSPGAMAPPAPQMPQPGPARWAPGGKLASISQMPTLGPSAPPSGTPPAGPGGFVAPSYNSPVGDFFRNNPALISSFAASIGSAPNMRTGIAQGAAGIPQAMQADMQTRGTNAVSDYFKNPDVTKGMSPAQLKLMQANPQLGMAYLSNTMVPKLPTWGVISEDTYTGAKQYGWINPFDQKVTPGQPANNQMPWLQPGGGAASPTPASGAASPPPDQNASGGQDTLPGQPTVASSKPPPGQGSVFAAIPPAMQSIAQKMVQGQMPFETARQLGMSPQMYQTLLDAANEYAVSQGDPGGFDATHWSLRANTINNFNAGNTSPNSPGFAIGKGRTSIGHLDQLSSLIDKLPDTPGGNIPFAGPLIRGLQQSAARGTNSDTAGTLSAWDTTVGLLASELTNFYRGGGGNEADISRFIDQLSAAHSKTELYRAVTSAVDLMKSRIGSYQDQWHQAMGNAVPDFPIFTSDATAALDRIQQRAQAGLAKESASANPSAASPATDTPLTPDAAPEGSVATSPDGKTRMIKRGGQWYPYNG